MADPVIYYQWQNEFLERTIYPLRDYKLVDFLQLYFEIDTWQQYKNRQPAELAGEILSYRTALKSVIQEAYTSFQKQISYFLDEDCTDQFRLMVPNLDLDTMKKINDLHKVFKQFYPTYQNPVKEKYFTSERARQMEDLRKRTVEQLTTWQRLFKNSSASSPQKPIYEANAARFTTALKMIDLELSRLYDFIKAYARLDIYKQEALKQKAAREKSKKDADAQLRTLKMEVEGLQERFDLAQRLKQRLASRPNPAALKPYFLDDDVSDLYRKKVPGIDDDMIKRLNNLHKDFKSAFPTYKNNPVQERSFTSQRIKEFEETRRQRAQELAGKQRAFSWLQKGTPGWDANQKAVDGLKNQVLRPLDEELNALYDLLWSYDCTAKPAAEINTMTAQNQKDCAALETQLKSKQESAAALEASLLRLEKELSLGEKEQLLAQVDALPVTAKEIARAKVDAYKNGLEKKISQQLLEEIVQRFIDQPERYPLWLQYMVIHFSGMRYQSAHGSWADPKDLLLALRMKDIQEEIKRLGDQAAIDLVCDQRFQSYQSAAATAVTSVDAKVPPPALATASEPKWKEKVSQHLRALDPVRGYNRKQALLNLLIDEEDYEIDRMADKEALEQLEGMKSKLPDWMWNEIVKLTDIRLKEVHDFQWEQASDEDMAKRYTQQMAPYREILENWKRNNLTGWREEHDRSSQLIVTRAVCNEVAEHIQHLRGHSPTGGLTAKPDWYKGQERQPIWAAAGDKAYLVKAKSPADFKPGASILWLQWVNKEPNAWQIARPIQLNNGEELIPVLGDANTRITNTGKIFLRDAHLQIKDASGKVTERSEHQWLRWLHEATVVDTVEMIDGPSVLTFETALPFEPRKQSTIGVFKRPASSLMYQATPSVMNGVFVGYVPEAGPPYEDLHEMLDWNHVLLKNTYSTQQIEQYWEKVTRPIIQPVSFDLGMFGRQTQVEVSPPVRMGRLGDSIHCLEMDSQSLAFGVYQPPVELRRGMRLWVDMDAFEQSGDVIYYPVKRCDEEPRAEGLYVGSEGVVAAQQESASSPRRVKKGAALMRICGIDDKGRPIFEETGARLPKGTRLRVSTVQRAGPADSGSGVVRAKGRQAFWMVSECPNLDSASGLFIRTSDLAVISEKWYARTAFWLGR